MLVLNMGFIYLFLNFLVDRKPNGPRQVVLQEKEKTHPHWGKTHRHVKMIKDQPPPRTTPNTTNSRTTPAPPTKDNLQTTRTEPPRST